MAIEPAIIVDVYPDEYAVLVRTEKTHRDLRIEIPSLYCSSKHSGGLHYMPEPGTTCFVIPYMEDHGYLVSFSVDPDRSPDGGTWKGTRPSLHPGDIVMSTKSGNGVVVASSGLVRVSGSSMCSRTYIPLGGLVQDHFLRYRSVSPMGSLEWYSTAVLDGSEVDSPNDDVYSVVRQQVKSKTQDAIATVDIAYGEVSSTTFDTADAGHILYAAPLASPRAVDKGQSGRISVSVRSTDGASLYHLSVSESGDLGVFVQNVEVHVKKNAHIVLSSRGTLEFGEGRLILESSEGSVQAIAKNALLSVLNSLDVNSGELRAIIGSFVAQVSGNSASLFGNVEVGSPGAGAYVVVNRGELLTLLSSHTHTVVGATPISPGAPVLAAPSLELSGISASVSSKLKAE